MKTTKYALAIALGIIALVAGPAYANTITDTLNFTTTTGAPTPTGSVTLDTTTNMFSVLINWDGLTIQSSGGPNDPFSNGSSLFAFFTQTQDLSSCSGGTGTYSWSFAVISNFPFSLAASNCAQTSPIIGGVSFGIAAVTGTPTDPNASASGGWSASVVTAPEPSSIILLVSGLLGLGAAGRRKVGSRNRCALP